MSAYSVKERKPPKEKLFRKVKAIFFLAMKAL